MAEHMIVLVALRWKLGICVSLQSTYEVWGTVPGDEDTTVSRTQAQLTNPVELCYHQPHVPV